MAYDYDTDILGALWSGAEDAEEPYASFIAANPDLTDDAAEARILSTIELLRSHMELLASRTEAALFRQVLSRTIRAAGSGGFVYNTDAPIQVLGNICNPVFPAGATFDITVDGSTTAVTSASGGDLDTVIAELNATLDASIAGVAEVTSTSTAGKTGAGLSGKHFLLNSALDATEYYVWFDFPGDFEDTSIEVTAGDVGGALGGTRFDINSANDDDLYYVWIDHPGLGESMSLDFTGITGGTLPTGAVPAAYFDIDSTTAAYRLWFNDTTTIMPAAGGRTLTAVAFTGADADTVIAGSVVGALTGADADFAGFAGAPLITGTLASVGNVTDPVDGAVATGATIATTTDGAAAAVDPAPGGRTAITATIAVGDSASEVATAVRLALDGNVDFDAEGAGNPFTVTNVAIGATTDAEDQDTGFTISVTTQGADAAEDPAPVGKTSISVGIGPTTSDAEIGSTMRTTIGGVADFSTEGVGTSVVINNAAVGATTDASDVDTTLVLTVDTQGVTPVGDVIGVTAFKTINNKLGFRSQVDFLAFEVADGGGGILGNAGIAAQTIESKRKIVADSHRDDSLGVFRGFRRPPDL